MKEKAFKVIGIVLSIAIFFGANTVYVKFFGHPIYKYHLIKMAEKYIEETYSGTDYKTNGAYIRYGEEKLIVEVISPSQEDVKFGVYCDFFGAKGDTYEADVLSGKTASERATWQYSNWCSAFAREGKHEYKVEETSGFLTVTENKAEKGAMFMGDFERNVEFDFVKVGERGGHLQIVLYSDLLTVEELCNALLSVKASANEYGLGFYTITCRMVSSLNENYYISVTKFLNEDIKDDEEFRLKVVETSIAYT